jgi:hypothetical protein
MRCRGQLFGTFYASRIAAERRVGHERTRECICIGATT